MLSKRKKILVLTGMFVLLIATAVLNYVIANADGDVDDVITTGSFFTQFRAERLSTRNQEILYLDSIIATTEAALEDARTAATTQKLSLIERMELETNLEFLIKGRGYEDVVVSIGSVSENVNVIYKAAELLPQDAAIIYTLIFEEAGVSPDKVRIVPIE